MLDNLYVFLIRNDIWIYILCGLVFVWYFSQLLRSRGILKRSMFGLEIERGRRLMSRSLALVILSVVVAGLVIYVNLSIAPTLPAELLRPPTPTPNIFATPLSSPTPSGVQVTPTIALAPTVTLAPSGPPLATGENPLTPEGELPVGEGQEPTAEPSAAPTEPVANCEPGIAITSPPTGAVVASVVTFFGTATAESFGYFELEVNGPRTGGVWTSLPVEEATEQVFNNILGSADVSSWQSGPHSFRLSVYDPADTLVGQCAIQLVVETGIS